jgi:hypothetical protein
MSCQWPTRTGDWQIEIEQEHAAGRRTAKLATSAAE